MSDVGPSVVKLNNPVSNRVFCRGLSALLIFFIQRYEPPPDSQIAEFYRTALEHFDDTREDDVTLKEDCLRAVNEGLERLSAALEWSLLPPPREVEGHDPLSPLLVLLIGTLMAADGNGIRHLASLITSSNFFNIYGLHTLLGSDEDAAGHGREFLEFLRSNRENVARLLEVAVEQVVYEHRAPINHA